MRYQRSVFVGSLSVCLVLSLLAGALALQIDTPLTYPSWKEDPNNLPWWMTLNNNYIGCLVGVRGNIKAGAYFSDGEDGLGDKVPGPEHDWGVTGRYGVVTSTVGDPETNADNKRPLTFMGMAPCHYFGYWKLRVGTQMRMIGDGTGSWYRAVAGQQPYIPTLYPEPPPDMKSKEPRLGVTGPFIRAIWATDSSTPSRPILTEIRIHLVRDMVRFEYRITNTGTVTENIGFSQNGDVEVGDPVDLSVNNGGFYGPYCNRNYAFLPNVGAAKPITLQHAMMFGGYDPTDSTHRTLNPPVPDSFEIYDDFENPINGVRNTLALEDATKPDVVAIGEYNDLFHKDMWVPTDYSPDPYNTMHDMCWVLCWDQKPLAPGATRTIITYYGLASATSRWTYRVGRTAVRDSGVLAVQAPKSLMYDSADMTNKTVEISPEKFKVKAYVYNLATDPGPYDLRDATASIWLPPGLQLDDVTDNEARKEIGMVPVNSESQPVVWTVKATGDYVGELPIYVSVVDNDPSGKHWQQTVVRKIYVPATKRGQFKYGWQLMHVPFVFNNPSTNYAFQRALGTFSAKYWDASASVYKQMAQLKPGQAFWMYIIDGPTWKVPEPFFLAKGAAIVGEDPGTGKQALEQRIPLSKGWNMIGNPFVYPMWWGQVLVYNSTGDETKPLEDAYRNGWINKTLFSWNTDKWDYDITSDSGALLDPWKGYWVMANRPVILIFRPPVLPGADVMAKPGGI